MCDGNHMGKSLKSLVTVQDASFSSLYLSIHNLQSNDTTYSYIQFFVFVHSEVPKNINIPTRSIKVLHKLLLSLQFDFPARSGTWWCRMTLAKTVLSTTLLSVFITWFYSSWLICKKLLWKGTGSEKEIQQCIILLPCGPDQINWTTGVKAPLSLNCSAKYLG